MELRDTWADGRHHLAAILEVISWQQWLCSVDFVSKNLTWSLADFCKYLSYWWPMMDFLTYLKNGRWMFVHLWQYLCMCITCSMFTAVTFKRKILVSAPETSGSGGYFSFLMFPWHTGNLVWARREPTPYWFPWSSYNSPGCDQSRCGRDSLQTHSHFF